MTDANRYPVVITFRIDEPTRARIDEVAGASGMSANIFCRKVVLREVGSSLELPLVRRAVADREQLRVLLGELGRQGSNLNQLARRANAGASTDSLSRELAAMRSLYEDTLACITAVLGTPRDP